MLRRYERPILAHGWVETKTGHPVKVVEDAYWCDVCKIPLKSWEVEYVKNIKIGGIPVEK